jgi:hypothetical protein
LYMRFLSVVLCLFSEFCFASMVILDAALTTVARGAAAYAIVQTSKTFMRYKLLKSQLKAKDRARDARATRGRRNGCEPSGRASGHGGRGDCGHRYRRERA